ncbi:DUF3859 domain-containing protein [Pseudoalteromonas carrageenovora]|uniref:DUF3859 domain-containing protein n=1 Tax=Pseudoalteromonas carrageenovora TaxID=227 RepID=UPI0026E1239F|nr:DUF3859 domain-containing protein [Pseudoalteromonas carrageenovora]MDO6463244.1 DUF3859 domain-containing protein [Pseudoalteromonas carrageenovora]
MAKSKPEVSIQSYGIYSTWYSKSKALPQIEQFTTNVTAKLDVEFGLIVNIKKAKGEKLHFCIYHPDIPNEEGEVMAPFHGVEYVKDNDWHFYLGDTLWEPIENKLGDWRMTLTLNNKVIADKTFNIALEQQGSENEFWRKRGY